MEKDSQLCWLSWTARSWISRMMRMGLMKINYCCDNMTMVSGICYWSECYILRTEEAVTFPRTLPVHKRLRYFMYFPLSPCLGIVCVGKLFRCARAHVFVCTYCCVRWYLLLSFILGEGDKRVYVLAGGMCLSASCPLFVRFNALDCAKSMLC